MLVSALRMVGVGVVGCVRNTLAKRIRHQGLTSNFAPANVNIDRDRVGEHVVEQVDNVIDRTLDRRDQWGGEDAGIPSNVDLHRRSILLRLDAYCSEV